MCIRTEILTVEELRRNVLSNKICFHFHDYPINIYIYIYILRRAAIAETGTTAL